MASEAAQYDNGQLRHSAGDRMQFFQSKEPRCRRFLVDGTIDTTVGINGETEENRRDLPAEGCCPEAGLKLQDHPAL